MPGLVAHAGDVTTFLEEWIVNAPRPIPVSAPGKLFLLGEYAVLAGGPALVTTVERHIHVRPRDDDDGYQLRGADVSDSLRLPILVRRVLAEREDIDADVNRLTADVSEFFCEGKKLGLGSSAASTVALVTALAPHLSRRRRFELADEIHRRFQDGNASGADIAASIFGGTMAFHLRDKAQSTPFDDLALGGIPDPVDAIETETATLDRSINLPDELRVDAVWTGQSAHSASFVDAVAEALSSGDRAASAILESIASRARVGIRALRQGDPDRFVDATKKGDRAMEQLGAATGLPIITDTHRRIRALAHTTHSVAKPSGAGGGDFTLLISPANAPLPRPIEQDYQIISVHR